MRPYNYGQRTVATSTPPTTEERTPETEVEAAKGTYRIFISSPGDVGQERGITQRVIERIRTEFSSRTALVPILWEHEPLRATETFQEQIPLASEADLVIIIVWSRLGTRLPEHIVKPDGSRYNSGTEFEFEDARKGYLERGVPDILVYRKTATPAVELTDEQVVLERLEQKKKLDDFLKKWFQGQDGSFTAAFHAFGTPEKYEELLETHLRKLVAEKYPHQVETPSVTPPQWLQGSPFRGLQAFDFEHTPIFLGRTQAISEVLDALRKQDSKGRNFVLILGGSGIGKSSLARAGVLPVLTEPGVIEGVGLWRRAVMRPGDAPTDPLLGLASALMQPEALPELGSDGTTAEELAAALRESPKAIVSLIRARLQQAAEEIKRTEKLERVPQAKLALLVDQLEELFTLERLTPSERETFASVLDVLARSGHVWIMATLRSDLYARFAELPQLMALKEGAGQYDLRPATPAEIGQIVRQPARLAGLSFAKDERTGESLDDVLRDEAVQNPEALPLLEFTLEQLYQKRSERGVLTLEAYQELGGVQGALARRAEATFGALSPEVQGALTDVLSALISVDLGERAAATRRRAPLGAITAESASRELVEAFTEARLVVTDRTEDGTEVVGIAHEALLRHWPRVQEWIAKNKDLLRTRARIATSTSLWQEEGRPPARLLPPGKSLDDAKQLFTSQRHLLTDDERSYIEASLQKDKRQRKRTIWARGAVATILLLMLGGSLFIWDGWWRDHVRYYQAFTKRFGAPVGVGELNREEVAHRPVSLRLIKKGRLGEAYRMEAVDSNFALTNTHVIRQFFASWDLDPCASPLNREVRWEFQYDNQDLVVKEEAFNKSDGPVFKFDYEPSDTSEVIRAKFVDSEGLAKVRALSGAAYVKFTRSKDGLDERLQYFDPNNLCLLRCRSFASNNPYI